jgi:hypothetical protein
VTFAEVQSDQMTINGTVVVNNYMDFVLKAVGVSS